MVDKLEKIQRQFFTMVSYINYMQGMWITHISYCIIFLEDYTTYDVTFVHKIS